MRQIISVRPWHGLALVWAFAGLVGCAHVSTTTDPNKGMSPTEPNGMVGIPGGENAVAAESPTGADLNDTGADLKAVPLAVNRQVLKWIDYFQGQGRPHMERYLSRSTRYMPVMKKILKENGLPEDLIYIALIESGFSGTAHSSASAVGYWQFIRGTGKRYGLKIDTYMDERRDFVRSTQAACGYFKGLYEIFHSWYLAIASYNVGEGRVKNVVQKYRTRDFWQLARENKLPLETSDYVPKFIAARLIAKEPTKYGFTDIEYMPPLEYGEVDVATSVDFRKLATEMQLDYDDLRDLNPSYKRGVAFNKTGRLTIRVPKGTEEKALASAGAAAAGKQAAYVAEEDYGYYRIRRGDTISVIAKKFGTTQREIRTLNKLSAQSALVAGKRLRVPAENIAGLTKEPRPKRERESSEQSTSESTESARENKESITAPAGGPGTANSPNQPPTLGLGAAQKYMTATRERRPSSQRAGKAAARKIHIVRKGDTLIQIARKYRVSIHALARQNQISRRSKVMVGTRLEIP